MLLVKRVVLPCLEMSMKAIWLVRWHGTEDECTSLMDALDRWEQLDAQGIGAEVFQAVAGTWIKIVM
jgi:hypothetical protein